MAKNLEINAQPPIEKETIRIDKPQVVAGGLPALQSSVKHLMNELDPSALKTLFKVNQVDGFDCPGCAWPDPHDHRSKLGEYCENGAKAIAEEATKKRLYPNFFEKYSVQELTTYSDFWLGKQGRLTQPMFLAPSETHYKPIAWDAAFTLIAQQLNNLKSPNEALFYTSGRTSNEAAFLYQLFVRQFGTNNLPDCSNMCHESSGVALSETVGIGKGSVTLDDFYATDLIMVVGQNPGTNHPRMLSALKKATQNGAKIISINPLPETGLVRFKHPQHPSDLIGKGTKLTDLFLPVRINGDVAVFKAIMRILLDEEDKHGSKPIFDHDFIAQQTLDYDQFIADLRQYKLSDLVPSTGLSLAQIKAAANMVMTAKNIIICWAMGITQHKNGVHNIREIVNLLLLKGSIGKKGAGTCPVRGHSNVQGDRTMGIWESPKPAFLNQLKKVFKFDPPTQHGYNTVQAIEAMHEGKAKVFFAMGGNFLSASPDTEYTAKALQNCDLTVQISTKLNRSHLIHGKAALILPCLGRTERDVQLGGEQFVSVENSMGFVHKSKGVLAPASNHLKSEIAIVCALAKATLGKKSTVNWDKMVVHYDNIRNAIAQVIPGFEQYNERLQGEGFYLPNGARTAKFTTPSGKAHFTINQPSELQLAPGEYLMMTIRSHDQFNTTIYGLDDRYRGIYNGRRVVMMNEQDMKAAKLKQGDMVDLYSNYNNTKRTAECFMVVPYPIPSRCVATYFPEANVLVPIHAYADRSYTPASKSIKVQISLINNS
jgi:molybdopterin-dependent oxidoreductase alpha subunit